MARTPPLAAASRASRTTLMPGLKSSRRARRRSASPSLRRSAPAFSRARMDVPSIATPFVRITRSPGCWLSLRTSLDFSTSPSIWPTRTGLSRPAVTSVWPPQSVTPNARQARSASRKMRRTRAGVVRRSGSRSVARNQRGRAPSVATSLALMLTAYQPRRSAVKVMGSVFATRYRLPQSITAASSPRRGPRTTRDDFGMGHDASSDSSRRGGSLPTGSLAPWRMERGVYPRENLLARRRKAAEGATASIAPGLVVYLGCHGQVPGRDPGAARLPAPAAQSAAGDLRPSDARLGVRARAARQVSRPTARRHGRRGSFRILREERHPGGDDVEGAPLGDRPHRRSPAARARRDLREHSG